MFNNSYRRQVHNHNNGLKVVALIVVQPLKKHPPFPQKTIYKGKNIYIGEKLTNPRTRISLFLCLRPNLFFSPPIFFPRSQTRRTKMVVQAS